MQHTLMHLEHNRLVAGEGASRRTGQTTRGTVFRRAPAHALPSARSRIAAVLARIAERLDADALSPDWRRP